MLELEEAQQSVLAAMPSPLTEMVTLDSADGRVLAAPVHSALDLPPFDNSAMDGFAVRAADVAAASSQTPVRLRLAGKIAAGEGPRASVAPGTCIRIFTGSPMPPGSDAVVMQEDTQAEPNGGAEIAFLATTVPGENIRLRGGDVRVGQKLLSKGERLGPAQVSLLAAIGLGQVAVGRRPVVGLLATGSELREPTLIASVAAGRLQANTGESLETAGETTSALVAASSPARLGPGQIYESNRVGLAALARRAGAVAKTFPLVPDDLAMTRKTLEEALSQCEIVVTSGGVSVGEMDFIKQALVDIGGELAFWKVAVKPGRPFVFGRCRDRFVFGLPGNPVSALVTFLLLVRPALLRWQGASEVSLPAYPGKLAESLGNPGTRRHFMRVTIGTAGEVHSAGAQASHILSSLAAANGLVDVPPETTWPAGRMVNVLRWE